MASRRRLIVLLIVAVTAGLASALATFFFIPKQAPELSRQELITEVQSGYVHEVVVVDQEVIRGVSTKRGPFRVPLRRGDTSLIDELTTMGVDVKFETTPPGLI